MHQGTKWKIPVSHRIYFFYNFERNVDQLLPFCNATTLLPMYAPEHICKHFGTLFQNARVLLISQNNWSIILLDLIITLLGNILLTHCLNVVPWIALSLWWELSKRSWSVRLSQFNSLLGLHWLVNQVRIWLEIFCFSVKTHLQGQRSSHWELWCTSIAVNIHVITW